MANPFEEWEDARRLNPNDSSDPGQQSPPAAKGKPDADPADAAAWGGTGRSAPNSRKANGADNGEKPPRGALLCVKLPKVDIVKIPPRQWAYGHYLLFGKAAALAAVDGGGKGYTAVAMLLAFITGRALLAERIWRDGPVAIVTYEDSTEEWHRRIAAACIHYGINYDDVLERIVFIVRPDNTRVSFGEMVADRMMFPDSDEIISIINETSSILLIVDPFNLAHDMPDGNSNVMIAKVAAEMDRICAETNCAGLVLHHLRKGSTGTLDDMMGATSLRATFRATRILAKMTAEEAKALSVDKEPWRYSRVASVKANHAPPPDKAIWFKLTSVELGNGTNEYPDGDSVAVSTSWCPRALFDGMAQDVLEAVFEALRAIPHSPVKQAKNTPWAGKPLMALGGRSKLEASEIIKAWIENGILIKGEYYHEESKNSVSCVNLDARKVDEILDGIIRASPPPDGD